ncbi:Tctex1 domain-containing protein 1 [Lamellibrachia satsuma]|nr:Tctex1 domain-containing protein 1 [Lamellibrachia satsuma]
MNRGPQSQPAQRPERKKSMASQNVTLKKTEMHKTPTAMHLEAQPSPTIFSLMASKRLARQIASRVYARRSIVAKERARRVRLEPTYRTGPTRPFQSHLARDVIRQVVDSRLARVSYSAERAAALGASLSDEIKASVKRLNFDRYKYVVTVTLGEKNDQELVVTSRCAWDADSDNSATYEWQANDMFCCVVVFAAYHE